MVCRKIHESLEPHRVESGFHKEGAVPNMNRVASAFKSNPHTANFNTQFPRGHKKHHGSF